MSDTNIVILEGRIAKDPTSKELQSGVVVCNFSIAISPGKAITYLNCKVFGTKATELALNGKTGDTISLKGSIQTRKWEEKYYTEIVVDHFHLTAKTVKEVSSEFIAE